MCWDHLKPPIPNRARCLAFKQPSPSCSPPKTEFKTGAVKKARRFLFKVCPEPPGGWGRPAGGWARAQDLHGQRMDLVAGFSPTDANKRGHHLGGDAAMGTGGAHKAHAWHHDDLGWREEWRKDRLSPNLLEATSEQSLMHNLLQNRNLPRLLTCATA